MAQKKRLSNVVLGVALFCIAVAVCGFGVFALFQSKHRAEREVRVGLAEVGKALDMYFQDCKDFPTLEQGLDALLVAPEMGPRCDTWSGPYFTGASLLDPWGRRFIYERDGAYYSLKSYGHDGAPGGAESNADIALE